MNRQKIEKIRLGCEKYKEIMRLYYAGNVAEDRDFQRLYNGFYRIGHRPKDWYRNYYQMLEKLKIKNLEFGDILKKLKQQTGRIEASFASKMFATRNPKYPSIDKWVLNFFGMRLPGTYTENRINKIIKQYKDLITYYKGLIDSPQGAQYIKEFDRIFPEYNITNVKKLDFIIWQTR